MSMKYFFGYIPTSMGGHAPVKWCEENGVAVGGYREIAVKIELDQKEWHLKTLNSLAYSYSFKKLQEQTNNSS
jgi:hypothetical protein